MYILKRSKMYGFPCAVHPYLLAIVAPTSPCRRFSLVAVEELEFRDLNLRENVALLTVLKASGPLGRAFHLRKAKACSPPF